jgi:hypothetical protein
MRIDLGQLRLVALGALVGGAVAVAGAAGQGPFQAYDGSNPFNCTLQQVGQGTEFPDPDADPFCVEFDKTHQNLDTLGIVDFVSEEPARVAAASNKCFYYQHDHWRSRLVAENEATETYNWDGGYFFDKAKGTGGVYFENFTLNNQAADPTLLPGFPEGFKPFVGEGRGGGQATQGIPIDPRCVEKAEREDVYADEAAGEDDSGEQPGDGDPDDSPAGDGEGNSNGGGNRDEGTTEDRGSDPGFSETRANPTFTG